MEKTISTVALPFRKPNAPKASIEADHDDQSKNIFDDGQKTEMSISADGDFCVLKKTETPSKRRRVGRYALIWLYWISLKHLIKFRMKDLFIN